VSLLDNAIAGDIIKACLSCLYVKETKKYTNLFYLEENKWIDIIKSGSMFREI